MQRQGQAADLLLQYVVGDAHFDAVDGHLIAQGAREENQGNLGTESFTTARASIPVQPPML